MFLSGDKVTIFDEMRNNPSIAEDRDLRALSPITTIMSVDIGQGRPRITVNYILMAYISSRLVDNTARIVLQTDLPVWNGHTPRIRVKSERRREEENQRY